MTGDELIELATRYFTALDDRDSDALANLLAEDCVLRIETHDITHHGRAAIRALFTARWEVPTHTKVNERNHYYTNSTSPTCSRITIQFTVTYSGPEAPAPKSNANVFSMRDRKITRISVYMAGANSIKG